MRYYRAVRQYWGPLPEQCFLLLQGEHGLRVLVREDDLFESILYRITCRRLHILLGSIPFTKRSEKTYSTTNEGITY